MKLSEAILLGSTLSEQFFFGAHSSDGKARCALAAAADACGIGLSSLYDHFPWVQRNREMLCPQCRPELRHLERLTAFSVIVHLNDKHRWSREKIAEWVATIEPAEDIPAPKEQATEYGLRFPEMKAGA